MPQNISHSETDTYTLCEQAHLFGYGHGYQTKTPNNFLQYGNLYHEMLAGYYRAVQDEKNYDDCVDAGHKIWTMHLRNAVTKKNPPRYSLAVLNMVKPIYDYYVEEFDRREWQILAVEQYYEFPVGDDIVLNFAVDVAVKRMIGRRKGQLGVVDHKMTYNFITNQTMLTHSQLPKYIFSLNEMGTFAEHGEFTHGILNQARYREFKEYIPDQVFSRREKEWSLELQQAFMREYRKKAGRINNKRQIPVKDWPEITQRTLVKHICDKCDFVDPCTRQLAGEDITKVLLDDYQLKDYAYRELRKTENAKTGQDSTSESRSHNSSESWNY